MFSSRAIRCISSGGSYLALGEDSELVARQGRVRKHVEDVVGVDVALEVDLHDAPFALSCIAIYAISAYKINLEDKFGSLALIDVDAEAAAVRDEWVNQTLTTVNDSVVRLGVVEGEFHWHKHDAEDEFFYVVEGDLEIEVEGRDPFRLRPGQGVTIPRGVMHRPIAHTWTVILMVEPATDAADGRLENTARPGAAPGRAPMPVPATAAVGRCGCTASAIPLAEDLLRLVVRDRAGDDHVLALLPVHGRRDPVLRGQLQRVDHAQHLVEVRPVVIG